jgi:hypothetical protein
VKKRIIFCFIFCAFYSNIFSQKVYSNRESYILSFAPGINSSDLYRDTINYSQGIFFSGGLINTFVLSKRINASVGILYTGKSVKKDAPIIKYHFEYLELPLYIQYKLSESIKVNTGFQYSKYLNSQFIFLDGSRHNGLHSKSLSSNMYNDYSVLVGAEFNLSKNVSIEGRYTLSLKSLYKNTPYFGMFQLSFNCALYKGYRQFFHKKEQTDNVKE